MSKPISQMNRKAAVRFAIIGGVIAALILGYQYLVSEGTEVFEQGTFASSGVLAAAQENEDGTYRAVMIKPDGTIEAAPEYADGANDDPPVWDASGNRLFFVSDREKREPHIFRWNPVAAVGPKIQRRSLDRRAKVGLTFQHAQGAGQNGLVIAGGTVIEFDPSKGNSLQVLPPLGRDLGAGGSEEGGGGQFEQVYQAIGDSFKKAQWGPNREFIVATMRAEEGEVLMIQSFTPSPQGDLSPPRVLVAGDRVDFDLNPMDGSIVYTVAGFRLPQGEEIPSEFIKNGKLVLPFRHAVGLAKMGEAPTPILVSNQNQSLFTSPKWAPTGDVIAVLGGALDEGANFQSQAIVLLQPIPGGNPQGLVSQLGPRDVSWHPNGQKLVFIGTAAGEASIYEVNRDGSGLTNRTVGKGSFAGPKFSPQSK